MAQRFPVRIYFGQFSATQFYAETGIDDQAYPHFLNGARVGDLLVHKRKPCGVLGNITNWDEYIDLEQSGIDFVHADNLMVFEDMAGVEYVQEWLRDAQFETLPTNGLTIESHLQDWFKDTRRGMFPSPNPDISNPTVIPTWMFTTPENTPYDTRINFSVVLKDPTTVEETESVSLPSTWSAGTNGTEYWLNIDNGLIVTDTISVGDVIEQDGNSWHIYAMDSSTSPDRLYYDPTDGGTQGSATINDLGGDPEIIRNRYDQSDPVYFDAAYDSSNKRETGGNPFEHTLTIINPNSFPVQAWVYAAYYSHSNTKRTNRDLYRTWVYDDTYPQCYVWIDANSQTDISVRLSAFSGSHQLAYLTYPTMEDIQPGFLIAEARNDLAARLAYAFESRPAYDTVTGYPKQMLLIVNTETNKYYKAVIKALSNVFLSGFGKRTEDSAQIMVQVLEEGAIDDIMQEFPESASMGYGLVRDERGQYIGDTKPADASPVTELWITDQGILRYVSIDHYIYNETTGARSQVTNVNRTSGIITHDGSVTSGQVWRLEGRILLREQNTSL